MKWCNHASPEKNGETYRIEYINGYENDGCSSGPTPATCEISLQTSMGTSGTFDIGGLRRFILACHEALELMEEHESDPQYPEYKGTILKVMDAPGPDIGGRVDESPND